MISKDSIIGIISEMITNGITWQDTIIICLFLCGLTLVCALAIKGVESIVKIFVDSCSTVFLKAFFY